MKFLTVNNRDKKSKGEIGSHAEANERLRDKTFTNTNGPEIQHQLLRH